MVVFILFLCYYINMKYRKEVINMNEEVFEKELNQYNKDMNYLIQSKKLMNLSEFELRKYLTNVIRLNNSIEGKYYLDAKYISDLFDKDEYFMIYNELQKLFNSFIPFITIRRFIHNIEKMGVECVCTLTNEYRDKGYCYSKAMDYII